VPTSFTATAWWAGGAAVAAMPGAAVSGARRRACARAPGGGDGDAAPEQRAQKVGLVLTKPCDALPQGFDALRGLKPLTVATETSVLARTDTDRLQEVLPPTSCLAERAMTEIEMGGASCFVQSVSERTGRV
jgi:hypothetical protein